MDLYSVLIGLIGVALGSVLTGYYTLHAQKQAAADQRQRDEEAERRVVEATLRAIAAELKVLKLENFGSVGQDASRI